MKIILTFILIAFLSSCSNNFNETGLPNGNCQLSPTPGPFPIGKFTSSSISGSLYFGYSTCGLNVSTKNGEDFEATALHKITLKNSNRTVELFSSANPISIKTLDIKIRDTDLADYVDVFNDLKKGKYQLIAYSKSVPPESLAIIKCGEKECGE